MTLVIGGAGQGKLALTLRVLGMDGAQAGHTPEENTPILNHLETWLKTETDPMPALEAYLSRHPDAVILCDEVGCGVVPMDRLDRDWRERVGRTCCALAARAELVVRVYCGIPTVLKGDGTLWN